jgi:hypothetical protein
MLCLLCHLIKILKTNKIELETKKVGKRQMPDVKLFSSHKVKRLFLPKAHPGLFKPSAEVTEFLV